MTGHFFAEFGRKPALESPKHEKHMGLCQFFDGNANSFLAPRDGRPTNYSGTGTFVESTELPQALV
jgi:hypothetical protein